MLGSLDQKAELWVAGGSTERKKRDGKGSLAQCDLLMTEDRTNNKCHYVWPCESMLSSLTEAKNAGSA